MGAPSAPDYAGAAEATAASDREMLEYQTRANRPNRNNPWGSESWEQDVAGEWTQNVNLNADSQAALDSQLGLQRGKSDLAGGMMGRLEDEFGEQMDWSKFGDQTDLNFNPDELRQRAEDASYDRSTSRLDPRFEQESQALEVKIRNQGLGAGDEAYDNAMANQGRTKEDAYANARNDATLTGRAESAQSFGQQQGQANYANMLRQNQISEEMKKRGTSLNEMNAVLNGQQVNTPEFQNFNQAGKAQATDYSGAAQSKSNAEQMAYQSQMGAISGLAGAGASAYTGGMFG